MMNEQKVQELFAVNAGAVLLTAYNVTLYCVLFNHHLLLFAFQYHFCLCNDNLCRV